MKLVHQCHVQSLFETIDEIVGRVREIGHPNFGLIFEAANLEQCGQDYGPAAIETLSAWIENVYLQNQRIRPYGAVTLETWCQRSSAIRYLRDPRRRRHRFLLPYLMASTLAATKDT